MKYIAILLVGFVAGYSVRTFMSPAEDINRHWQVINDYRAALLDPSQHKHDTEVGMWFMEDPIDPLPSLAALVSAGELKHLDIVFPTVPQTREVSAFLLKFINEHSDAIVEGIWNTQHLHYETQGVQPLHLNVWFRNEHSELIQELIRTIDANYSEDSQ